MKNPYKLILKANDTFNLFLSKYDEIEHYMNLSKEEMGELSESLQYLMKEDSVNKELLTNLESQVINLNNYNTLLASKLDMHMEGLNKLFSQYSNFENSYFNSLKNLKDYIDLNLIVILDYINNTRDLVGAESEKQLGEIRDLNTVISDNFRSNCELVGAEFEKQLGEIRDLNNVVNDGFNNTIDLVKSNFNDNHRDIRNIKRILDSQVDINKNLDLAVKLYVGNYNECKKYFFNDNEQLLSKYLDTDDLFRTCFFNNIKFLSYSPAENKILLKTKEGIILATNNRFYTIKEVIGFDGYSVPQLYQFDDFIVFDVGMNRAYASLRFAQFNNCSAVYGFEIDKNTYDKAIYNINLNKELSDKITPFNIGLSNKNESVNMYYLEGADGINTVEEDLVNIQYEMKEDINKVKSKTVKVKKSSEILGNLIKTKKNNSKVILKIDTEGSEYDIIDDLIESKLIYKIDLILGEGHRFNNRDLSKELSDLGFKKIENKDNNIVYNFAFVKKEYYDVWPLKE